MLLKRARLSWWALSLTFAFVIAAAPVAAQSTARISSPVESSSRVTLPKSVHPLANLAYDQGPADPTVGMERMVIVLAPSAEQEHQLQTFLDSQQTKGSGDYHRWLTPEEFGARFGPHPDDLRQVKSWLEQQGFNVGSVARSGRWIEFSGTAQQVTAAFQTSLRRLQAAGAQHIANTVDISIPAALAPVVRGVLSLNDFFSRPMLTHHYQVHRDENGVFVPVNPDFTYNPANVHYLAPADYAGIYNLNPLHSQAIDGSGQTIAIVGTSKVELTDLQIFRSVFNLPSLNLQMIVNGTDPGFTGWDDSVEASLDVQWAGAVAPGATIKLVVSQSTTTTDGVDLSAAYIVDHNLADVISVSFGNCEQNLTAAENAFWAGLWQQAAAQGISVFVASGDSGAAGCDYGTISSQPAQKGPGVNALAATPFNTAVGGTEFQENGNDSTFWGPANTAGFGSVLGYVPEAVWNESCDPTPVNALCPYIGLYSLVAGGGGASKLYPKPSWQTGLNVPADGYRDLPDVSLAAASDHDGYLFCFEGSCGTTTDSKGAPLLVNAGVVGGTSASSPAFAGMLALVNQKAGGRQGLANYMLYKLASSENFSACDSSAQTNPLVRAPGCIFNDITAGNNTVPGQTGYNAATGFDLASGLGSVNAVNLVAAWTSAAAGFRGSATTLSASVNGTSATSIPFQHGGAVSLQVQVQPISGTGTPTGAVSFLTDANDVVGNGLLANGSFSGTFNSLPGGTYNLKAHYPGDGTFGSSDSNAIAVNVTPEDSSVTVSTDICSGACLQVLTPFGNPFNIRAVVAGASGAGVATGTVTFTIDGTATAQVPLDSSGSAQLGICGNDYSCLALGTHTITAAYSGDKSLNASSTAGPLAVTIAKGSASAFLMLAYPGQGKWQLVVELSGGSAGAPIPTGTVQFLVDNAPLGAPVSLAPYPNSVWCLASMQTTFSPGVHLIAFSYSGDNTYNAFSTSPFSETIPAPFELSTANAIATIKSGQTAMYNLTLSSNLDYTGTVSLSCSGAPTGTSCAITPSVVNLSYAPVSLTVSVSTVQTAKQRSAPFRSLPLVFAIVFAGVMCSGGKRSKALVLILTLAFIAGISSCGSGSHSSPTPTPTPTPLPQSVAIIITGSDGQNSNTLVLALKINP